jgi:hypothetical protein
MSGSPEQSARLSMARCNPIPLYNISRFPEYVVTTSHHLDSYMECDQFQLLASYHEREAAVSSQLIADTSFDSSPAHHWPGVIVVRWVQWLLSASFQLGRQLTRLWIRGLYSTRSALASQKARKRGVNIARQRSFHVGPTHGLCTLFSRQPRHLPRITFSIRILETVA